ncbi:MBL fold metallo-hydrolase [Salinispora arenicola]|uniref:Glyoxylase-like metal-dependent hydrolase (Beta-lactamase superfamily II) n=1 Tax=Salinispora arenicola TaxID=168697 RepID=A0A542XPV5_SALAC|nr:MBL fold metallo-hydrolase [Salinispora arenicola]TQL37887.1 glyoxylase-like metal-dependent hydrolase (beta-lactamase superfamily II) [Salinispora arenicola]GIM85850.1 Zn-dependent hydrolase [Salinispora arenicola]
MTYTGDVTPGGPPAVRELDRLTIAKLSVGPMDNNAYLLRCRTTGEQVLVDAANEAPRLLELIGDAGLATVVTTHQHMDHWLALEEVVAETGARPLAHAEDAPGMPIKVDPLADGDRVSVGDCTVEVIHLRGHTPGSIALLYQDPAGTSHLFTGDSLFPGGPGRTTSPTDFAQIMDDLEAKVFGPLPDETWIYPGHGNDSTLGAERPHLGEWRTRGW